jgi:hypothetical protein
MNVHTPVELPSHDVLSRLARDDPEAYEALRREVIDSFIENAPARLKPRLYGIQFRVDCVRRLSRSALGSTVRVYELMWESFHRLNGNWQQLVQLKEGGFDALASTLTAAPASGGARILAFRPRAAGDQDCAPT